MKIPANVPSTTCVARSLMKLRRIRDVYWLEASASVTSVMENVIPTTVIIEPAIVDSMPRAPAAPEPKRRGQRASQSWPAEASTSINPRARLMLAATISEGMNQKLARRLPMRNLILCTGRWVGNHGVE